MSQDNPTANQAEVDKALEKIGSISKEIEKLEWTYERLVAKREILMLQAVFQYWKSISLKNDYLYGIRLSYSTYEYDCGMLNENLTSKLLALDGVSSNGNEEIRIKRREQVKRILTLQDETTVLHTRAVALSNFYRAFVSSPRYQALLSSQEIPVSPVVEEPSEEPAEKMETETKPPLKRAKSVHVVHVMSPEEFEEARRSKESAMEEETSEPKSKEENEEARHRRKAEKRKAKRQAKQAKRREEEEARREAEEEARKQAEEAKREAEEAQRAEEEARRQVEEAKKRVEEARKRAEEAQRRAEEERRKSEEEARRRAEEEEAERRAEEEARRQEELKRQAEEAAKREAEEKAAREAALKRQEEEEAAHQAELKKQEEEAKQTELKQKEEEAKKVPVKITSKQASKEASPEPAAEPSEDESSDSFTSAEEDTNPEVEEAEESEDDSLEGIRSDYNPKYQWLRQGNKLHLMLMNVDFDQKSLRCITRPSKPTAKVVIQGYRIEKNEQPTGYYAMFYGSRPSYRYIPFTTVLMLPDVPIDFKKAPRATYYDDQSVMDITYTLKEEEEKPRVVRGHKRASPQPMSMPSREEEPRRIVANPFYPDMPMDSSSRRGYRDPRYEDYDSDGESGYYSSPYYRNPYNPYRQQRRGGDSFYPYFGNGLWWIVC